MLGVQYVVWFVCRDTDFLYDCYCTQFGCRLFQKVLRKLWRKDLIEEGIQSVLPHYLYFVILAPSSDLVTALPITSRISGLTRLVLIQSLEQPPDTYSWSFHTHYPQWTVYRESNARTDQPWPHTTHHTPSAPPQLLLQFPVSTVPKNVVLFNIQNSSPLLLCWSCALLRPTDLQ